MYTKNYVLYLVILTVSTSILILVTRQLPLTIQAPGLAAQVVGQEVAVRQRCSKARLHVAESTAVMDF